MAEATSILALPITQATGTAATGPVTDSSLTLLMGTATADVLRGEAGDSDLDIPSLTGEAFVEPIQTLPMLVADGMAHSGRSAGSAETLYDLSGTAYAVTSAVGSSAQELPALTGDGFALAQRLAASTQGLTIWDGAGSATTGRMGASVASLPTLSIDATASTDLPVYSLLTLPALTGSGVAVTSRIAASAQALPQIVVEGLAYAQTVVTSGQTLPVWEAEGIALASRVGVSTLTIPRLEASGSVGSDHQAASSLTLPMIQAGEAWASGEQATSILVLPVWVATGTATSSDLGTATSKAYAVNAETYAQSHDEGIVFNSVARLGALFIGANENGLYLLGAYTDDGAAIQALAKFPMQDEDGAMLRRVESMVVGYRADGDMRLTVETDDADPQEYVLESVGGTECHPARVKIGKGMKGRYWTMTLENIEGADFATDKVDLDWQNLSRRTR